MAINYEELVSTADGLIKGTDYKWSSLNITYSFVDRDNLPSYYTVSTLFWDIHYGLSVGPEDFANFISSQISAVHNILDPLGFLVT